MIMADPDGVAGDAREAQRPRGALSVDDYGTGFSSLANLSTCRSTN